MDRKEFRKFLDLLMCCDPWPVENDEQSQEIILDWANNEAVRHGFSDWIAAYHKLEEAE